MAKIMLGLTFYTESKFVYGADYVAATQRIPILFSNIINPEECIKVSVVTHGNYFEPITSAMLPFI